MAFEAQVEYTADGVANDFTVTFGYLKKSHVKLYVNGVEDKTFTWIDSTSIAATTLPALNDTVLITRNTPRAALVYEIPNSGTYKGADLNNQALQALYIAAEGYDALNNTISLDTNDNKWDADTKRIKNVQDPVDAQDVATKNYADTNGSSFAALAKAWADAAAASAAAAATSETNAESYKNLALASQVAANADRIAAEAAAALVSGADQAVLDAKAWAITVEDTLVPIANGGNGTTEYSALHWAAKAQAYSQDALDAQTAAETAIAGIPSIEYPNNAREVLRGNQGIGLDFIARDFEIIDYSGVLSVAPTIIAHAATTNMVQSSTGGPITDRDGSVNALGATEVPFDHQSSGDIYLPMGFYSELGAQTLTIGAADFPSDFDNITIMAEITGIASDGDIVAFYATSPTTDGIRLRVVSGNVRAEMYSGSVKTGDINLGALPGGNTVMRACATIVSSGALRGVSSVQTTVQSASGTVPTAGDTFRIGGHSGHVRKTFCIDRRFGDDEMKTVCGVEI